MAKLEALAVLAVIGLVVAIWLKLEGVGKAARKAAEDVRRGGELSEDWERARLEKPMEDEAFLTRMAFTTATNPAYTPLPEWYVEEREARIEELLTVEPEKNITVGGEEAGLNRREFADAYRDMLEEEY